MKSAAGQSEVLVRVRCIQSVRLVKRIHADLVATASRYTVVQPAGARADRHRTAPKSTSSGPRLAAARYESHADRGSTWSQRRCNAACIASDAQVPWKLDGSAITESGTGIAPTR